MAQLTAQSDRTYKDILRDGLDNALNFYIADRFLEHSGERNEGATEYANPQTITQPVNQSQTPIGQPLNFLGNGFALTPVTLAIGAGVLLVGGVLLARLIK